ncbi:hypothetical protein ABW21_db0205548 [Orbilia brochopaga]|nr:hypothetical protein ABW21_db0205548 [Drechslerella brochopaga]
MSRHDSKVDFFAHSLTVRDRDRDRDIDDWLRTKVNRPVTAATSSYEGTLVTGKRRRVSREDSSTFLKLPTELLEIIFEPLRLCDLASISLTCRRFAQNAHPLLYRRVYLSPGDSDSRTSVTTRRLLFNHRLLGHARELSNSIRRPDADLILAYFYRRFQRSNIRKLQAEFGRLHDIAPWTNLTHMSLSFANWQDECKVILANAAPPQVIPVMPSLKRLEVFWSVQRYNRLSKSYSLIFGVWAQLVGAAPNLENLIMSIRCYHSSRYSSLMLKSEPVSIMNERLQPIIDFMETLQLGRLRGLHCTFPYRFLDRRYFRNAWFKRNPVYILQAFNGFLERHKTQLQTFTWRAPPEVACEYGSLQVVVPHDVKHLGLDIQFTGQELSDKVCLDNYTKLVAARNFRTTETLVLMNATIDKSYYLSHWMPEYVKKFENLRVLKLLNFRRNWGKPADNLRQAFGVYSVGEVAKFLPRNLEVFHADFIFTEEFDTPALFNDDGEENGLARLFYYRTALRSVSISYRYQRVLRWGPKHGIMKEMIMLRRRPYDYNNPSCKWSKKLCMYQYTPAHPDRTEPKACHSYLSDYREHLLPIQPYRGPDGDCLRPFHSPWENCLKGCIKERKPNMIRSNDPGCEVLLESQPFWVSEGRHTVVHWPPHCLIQGPKYPDFYLSPGGNWVVNT